MKWLSKWKVLYDISNNLNEVNKFEEFKNTLKSGLLTNRNPSQKMTEEQFFLDKIIKFRKLQQKQKERNHRQRNIERYGRYHKKFVHGFGVCSLAFLVGGMITQSAPLIGAAATMGSLVALRYTYLLKGHDEYDEKYHNKLKVKRGLNNLKSYAAIRQAEQLVEQLENIIQAEALKDQSSDGPQTQQAVSQKNFGKTLKRIHRELARSAKLIQQTQQNHPKPHVTIETMDGENFQMKIEDVPAYKDLSDQSGAIKKLRETGISEEAALYLLGLKNDLSKTSQETQPNFELEAMIRNASQDYPKGLSQEELLERACQVTRRWVELRNPVITKVVDQRSIS